MPIPEEQLEEEQRENLMVNKSALEKGVYSVTKTDHSDPSDKHDGHKKDVRLYSKMKIWIASWNKKQTLYLIILLLIVVLGVVLTLFFTNKPSAIGSFTRTVYGGWTSWGHWSTCTLSCGEGVKIRSRSCSNSTCLGDSFEITACTIKKCQEAGWTDWSYWARCSVTCGLGMKKRQRICSNPEPSPFGPFCNGSSEETKICYKPSCNEAEWSGWSDWGSCSVTCGLGLKRRQRQCNDPQPSPFGSYCNGSSEEVDTCYQPSCFAVGWSPWGQWSSCTESCGGGIQLRSRSCLSPISSSGQPACTGEPTEIKKCNSVSCPTAEWSAWSDWGSCSVTCGLGLKRRQRACTHPQPSPMGSYCNGSSEEVDICNQRSCSAVGCSPWGQWSPCTESCGGGIQLRSRSCLSPISSGQPACTGDHTEITKCNSYSCPNEILRVDRPLYVSNGVLGLDDQHMDRKINTVMKSSTGRVVYLSSSLLAMIWSVSYLLL